MAENEDGQASEMQTDQQSKAETQDTQGSGQELFDGKPFNAETAKALITKLRQESRDYKTTKQRLAEFEEAEQKRKEAELSETDKLNKRLADAESAKEQALRTANERLLKAAFVAEAALAGAEHPGDAFLLADKTSVAIDDDGNVTGAAEAVRAIVESGRLPLKDKRRAPSLDGGKGGSGNPADTKATNLTEAELAQARKMRITPEQYAANKQK